MYGCTRRLMERLYTTGEGNEKRVATAKAQLDSALPEPDSSINPDGGAFMRILQ